MSVFPPHFGFHGTWRPYQQRVLDNLQSCLDDRKVHIVAAPGSGKTTVGLEILLRLGKPALILAPSITIREQWIDRFVTSFLPENESPDRWISRSIHSPKPLTVITYQALHSACNRLVGSESENGDEEEPGERENTDYSDFDLIGTLKKSGTGTVCLDEAHHLRSEWWKALETVVGALDGIVTVSLTATPPYDSTPAQWQRYIKLCGEIDAEIFTPELVKDHNLCPHQDYVYFNWPEQDEIDAIRRFRESACNAAFEVADEPTFIRAVSSHPGLTHIDDYTERFLDKPDYLTAILVFLSYHKIVFSKQLRKLIGTSAKLPRLDVHWMEVLLQGFLYHDADSYPAFEDYREELRKRLSRLGLISRKTVVLTSGDEINRLLITSRGKLNSIREIVRAEHTSLAGKLRMLILTDYIKKDMVPLIGNPEEAVRAIGVVPIFEMLRREQTPGLKLGALSGGFVAVPRESKDLLQEIADRKSVGVSFKDLNCPDYVEAVFSGSNQKQMVSVVTELFSRGGIHVLVGTKSLLGEGWDSPCINSLILASFVGSYILSNQMRGRAIRVDPAVPDKTANIWHLVSMEPVWAYSESVRERISSRLNGTSKTECPVSEDFAMLRRRFQAFLGVSYTEDVIEDGIDRLSVIRPPYDRTNIEKNRPQHASACRGPEKPRGKMAARHCELSGRFAGDRGQPSGQSGRPAPVHLFQRSRLFQRHYVRGAILLDARPYPDSSGRDIDRSGSNGSFDPFRRIRRTPDKIRHSDVPLFYAGVKPETNRLRRAESAAADRRSPVLRRKGENRNLRAWIYRLLSGRRHNLRKKPVCRLYCGNVRYHRQPEVPAGSRTALSGALHRIFLRSGNFWESKGKCRILGPVHPEDRPELPSSVHAESGRPPHSAESAHSFFRQPERQTDQPKA
jgi:superfamily II DNA or RNA helicase